MVALEPGASAAGAARVAGLAPRTAPRAPRARLPAAWALHARGGDIGAAAELARALERAGKAARGARSATVALEAAGAPAAASGMGLRALAETAALVRTRAAARPSTGAYCAYRAFVEARDGVALPVRRELVEAWLVARATTQYVAQADGTSTLAKSSGLRALFSGLQRYVLTYAPRAWALDDADVAQVLATIGGLMRVAPPLVEHGAPWKREALLGVARFFATATPCAALREARALFTMLVGFQARGVEVVERARVGDVAVEAEALVLSVVGHKGRAAIDVQLRVAPHFIDPAWADMCASAAWLAHAADRFQGYGPHTHTDAATRDAPLFLAPGTAQPLGNAGARRLLEPYFAAAGGPSPWDMHFGRFCGTFIYDQEMFLSVDDINVMGGWAAGAAALGTVYRNVRRSEAVARYIARKIAAARAAGDGTRACC